jgi:hypothetical protein
VSDILLLLLIASALTVQGSNSYVLPGKSCTKPFTRPAVSFQQKQEGPVAMSAATDNISSEREEETLVPVASSWCASHGVLMGSKLKKEGAHDYVYEPAPFSLHPSPFPKAAFNKATDELGLHFNHVVHAIAEQYEDWLRPTIKVAAASDKEFTGRLVELADEVYANVKEGTRAQNVALGVFR